MILFPLRRLVNTMTFQQTIPEQLLKGSQFQILLPVNPNDISQSADKILCRDWLVPGERAMVFVVLTKSLSAIDCLSFYCTVADAEHPLPIDFTPEQLPLSSINLTRTLPHIEKFKSIDDKMVFPVRITVPLSYSKEYIISAFCSCSVNPVASITCQSVMPFSVFWSKYMTSQSIIIVFSIKCSLPVKMNGCISISSYSLKFNEKMVSEIDYSQNIAIVPMGNPVNQIFDQDSLNVAFAIKPLNDIGSSRVSKLPLVFSFTWRVDGFDYTSSYTLFIGNEISDLVITAPTIEAKLFKESRIPITITSISNTKSRSLEFVFNSGCLQPMTKRATMILNESEQVKILDFKFIPLVSGKHEVDFIIHENEKKLKPMYPIQVNVVKD